MMTQSFQHASAMTSLAARVAIVTGAAGGIGRAIAKLLADQGASVVLVDRQDPAETASLLGENVLPITADVASDDAWADIAAATIARFGRCDIVVNNAGIIAVADIETLTFEEWRSTMAVNVDAHFFAAKHCVPLMKRERWGRFISISSTSIGSTQRGMSHYMASKMAVIGFVRGLANDVAEHNITVNAILPGLTDTAMTSMLPDAIKQQVWQAQAIKRFGGPDDIAGPVMLLASDAAGFITGQSLVVDGGLFRP